MNKEKQKIVINWSNIHERIKTAQIKTEKLLTPTQEEKKKILKARAKILASRKNV